MLSWLCYLPFQIANTPDGWGFTAAEDRFETLSQLVTFYIRTPDSGLPLKLVCVTHRLVPHQFGCSALPAQVHPTPGAARLHFLTSTSHNLCSKPPSRHGTPQFHL